MGEKLRGEADYRFIAVEPASCPSLTRGVYAQRESRASGERSSSRKTSPAGASHFVTPFCCIASGRD